MIEPGVRLIGDVLLGEGVSIAGPAELMAKHSSIYIGAHCDIAAFVTITTADSHMRTLELAENIERLGIMIGEHCFIGVGAVILGGTHVGHHSCIGAGVVLKGQNIPPYSRVTAPAALIEREYYKERRRA